MTVREVQGDDVDELRVLIDKEDAERVDDFLGQKSGRDVARLISLLTEAEQARLFTVLDPEDAADVIEEISDLQAADVIESLPPPSAAAILNELRSDEQADLLGAMGSTDAEAILAAMRPGQAAQARRLAEYAPDVAGGLMVTEFMAQPDTATLGQVIADLSENADAYSDYDVQYIYVVRRGRLVGVLPLRDLLLRRRHEQVTDIMIAKPLSVRDRTRLTDLGDFFDRHDFLGVPVVDRRGKLLGVLRRHDVEEALGDRTGQQYLKSQGIVGGEELRTMPLWIRSGRRLSWLSINIILNVIAASVIALHQDTLAAVIALAVFLPIISDMSGCSGNQAVAVSMRELTLGLARPTDVLRVWGKEVTVGLINGLVLGSLLGAVAWLWKGNVYLGLVVAAAMGLNTVVAVSIGGTVPLILKRFKLDPALASGPILTTITDLCGFVLVLSMARAMLSRLG